MSCNALHVFVYKSHLTFLGDILVQKDATYTRINTVIFVATFLELILAFELYQKHELFFCPILLNWNK